MKKPKRYRLAITNESIAYECTFKRDKIIKDEYVYTCDVEFVKVKGVRNK